jgi:uracil-DNA glycosylase family 4
LLEHERWNEEIVACRKCPRLNEWREEIARIKRRSFQDQTYWGKPIPYFGDPSGDLLIVGLAPAAHGANRTGRMFTGDRSGDFLVAALWRAGLANQPTSANREDCLCLHRVLIAATLHCAPPANAPLPEELSNCSEYLARVLLLAQWRSVLCLGGIAWRRVHQLSVGNSGPKFAHGSENKLSDVRTIIGCYHPSQQNTFTGRLTPPMMDEVIQRWASVV